MVRFTGAEVVAFSSAIGCDVPRTLAHLAFCARAIFRRDAADITRVGWVGCWAVTEPFNDSMTEIA